MCFFVLFCCKDWIIILGFSYEFTLLVHSGPKGSAIFTRTTLGRKRLKTDRGRWGGRLELVLRNLLRRLDMDHDIFARLERKRIVHDEYYWGRKKHGTGDLLLIGPRKWWQGWIVMTIRLRCPIHLVEQVEHCYQKTKFKFSGGERAPFQKKWQALTASQAESWNKLGGIRSNIRNVLMIKLTTSQTKVESDINERSGCGDDLCVCGCFEWARLFFFFSPKERVWILRKLRKPPHRDYHRWMWGPSLPSSLDSIRLPRQ